MFVDKRFGFGRHDIVEDLIEENSRLKSVVENSRSELQVWAKWWEKTGKFLIDPQKYDLVVQQKNFLMSENSKLKEKIIELEMRLLEIQLINKLREVFDGIFHKNIALPQQETFSQLQLQWLKLLRTPFRCLIIGKAGSGKSALAHFLLECFHPQKSIYIFGFPEDKIKYLPDYINVVASFKRIPMDSVCLIDEAYLLYGARQSMIEDKHFDLIQILGLFRQKNVSLIFITQNTSLIDKAVLGMVDWLIFKEITGFQIEFERSQLKPILKKAQEKFAHISGDKKRFNYLFSTAGNTEEFIENALPSYWSQEISNAYQSGFSSGERFVSKTSREEKKKMAQQYRSQGYSYKQIARILGVSKATIINWLKNTK